MLFWIKFKVKMSERERKRERNKQTKQKIEINYIVLIAFKLSQPRRVQVRIMDEINSYSGLSLGTDVSINRRSKRRRERGKRR